MYNRSHQKAFLNQPAPHGYVPGLGRGAAGFTTRSDIGPARDSTFSAPEPANAPTQPADTQDDSFMNENNYDEFSGYGGNLFAGDPYDKEDEEADKVYEMIDLRIKERRQEKKEKAEKEALEKFRKERPKLQAQFEDLKRNLGTMSKESWESIPESGTVRSKKLKTTRPERYTPVPDSVHIAGASTLQTTTSLDRSVLLGSATPFSGMMTPFSHSAMKNNQQGNDLTQIGEARNSMLGVKLDQISDSVHGQTTVDPKGYLTSLNSVVGKSASEVGDIKKARLLLKSVISTNPHHGPGWIAASRLEEAAGKIQAARNIIAKGCDACPKDEDVWLEAARMETTENAKNIIANAVRNMPESVKIWSKAVEFETTVKGKRIVLRKALEKIPNSVKLWKFAVELENEDDARILLSKAVECCPHSLEMWLALARLETYENARKILVEARKHNPTESIVWITAAKLEEANGNSAEKIIQRAVRALGAHQEIHREDWMEEAIHCEEEGAPETAQAIVRAVIELGVEEEDRKPTWIEDAENFTIRKSFCCAKAVYAHALTVFPSKKSLWLRAVHLQRNFGSPEELELLLQRAVRHCPTAEVLWLMGAKEKWISGDVESARGILAMAFEANPNSDAIWLAAVKLEVENHEYLRSRVLLEKARAAAGTPRVWMKSIVLERQLGDLERAKALLNDALKLYPTFPKLWMIAGQIEETVGDLESARNKYNEGTRKCPQSIPLWLLLASLDEKMNLWNRARAVYERARIRNPNVEELWIASIRSEMKTGQKSAAQNLLARGLQECPTSGLLWAESIWFENSKQQRKTKSLDALRKCENNPFVVLAVAKLFWSERRVAKARDWFKKVVKIEPDLGDGWAHYYKFEQEYGTEEEQQSVVQNCVFADPHHGNLWCEESKKVENWKLKVADILKLVSAKLNVIDWTI